MRQTTRSTNVSIALLVVAIISLCGNVHALNCNSNGNGNWSNAGTWTCANPPNPGDVITIQANTTVTITSNLTYTGDPMNVVVYGTWNFDGAGSKITMPCGSSVQVGFGGAITGNGSGNSQTVRICNTTYWNASDGPVAGPMGWPYYTLPVELTSYTGTAKGGKVTLEWSTATEMGSDRFEIFRSLDALEWEKVAAVVAAGNSSSIRRYSLKDEATNGTWYYRLKQIDDDGTVEDLGVIRVHVSGTSDLICGPVPAQDGWVNVLWPEGRSTAVITDMRGANVTSASYENSDGMLQVDVSRMHAGMHILTMYDERGDRKSCRVVIH